MGLACANSSGQFCLVSTRFNDRFIKISIIYCSYECALEASIDVFVDVVSKVMAANHAPMRIFSVFNEIKAV